MSDSWRREQYETALDRATAFLESTGDFGNQVIAMANELIGHQGPVREVEWDYYEKVERLTCPWMHQRSTNSRWTPLRSAEAMFENRAIVRSVLGDHMALEVAFGVAALALLAEAHFMEHYFSSQPDYDPHAYDGHDQEREEIFSYVSEAVAILALGRRLKDLHDAEPLAKSDLQKYRRRLNKSAAEIRNEPFKQLHWRFREYLAENQVKSIRSAARTFYENLLPDEQIYRSIDHAVRNLSEALYGKRGRTK